MDPPDRACRQLDPVGVNDDAMRSCAAVMHSCRQPRPVAVALAGQGLVSVGVALSDAWTGPVVCAVG
jgi:hypothetical protein